MKLEISQYYQTKSGRSTINDEIIQELVEKLNDLNDRVFLRDNKYFSHKPLHIGYRAYNLVWDYDESPFSATLIIINCYRESKYDKSK